MTSPKQSHVYFRSVRALPILKLYALEKAFLDYTGPLNNPTLTHDNFSFYLREAEIELMHLGSQLRITPDMLNHSPQNLPEIISQILAFNFPDANRYNLEATSMLREVGMSPKALKPANLYHLQILVLQELGEGLVWPHDDLPKNSQDWNLRDWDKYFNLRPLEEFRIAYLGAIQNLAISNPDAFTDLEFGLFRPLFLNATKY